MQTTQYALIIYLGVFMAIFTGDTVEHAIERGLKKLGVTREKVHVSVEQKEKKGFLGFGRKRAKVNIETINIQTVEKADRQAVRGVSEEAQAGGEKVKSAMESTLELSQVIKAVKEYEKQQGGLDDEQRQEVFEATKAKVENGEDVSVTMDADIEAEADTAIVSEGVAEFEAKMIDYLTHITDGMGVQTTIHVSDDEGITVFKLQSAQDGLLIGKHGKIILAMESLAKAYAKTLTSDYKKIALDVADYREKRKVYVVTLAKRAMERAKNGETVYLKDLQSNERRAIHAMVAKEPGVTSHSEGKEGRRYLIVSKQY
jgi:spoIIIJ-associated protein